MTHTNLTPAVESKNEAFFHELVPASGASSTLAGELLRASNRVAYRFWNDGDMAGEGYGNETVNPAWRFLCDSLGILGARYLDDRPGRAEVSSACPGDARRLLSGAAFELSDSAAAWAARGWRAADDLMAMLPEDLYEARVCALVSAVVHLVEKAPSLRTVQGIDFWLWLDSDYDVWCDEEDEEDLYW